MKLHEYQAKQLFAKVGIPVPRGRTVTDPVKVPEAFEALRKDCAGDDSFTCNVKAQLHAGGRGKAGGVRTAKSGEEAQAIARELIGKRLVTHQTGLKGLPVSAVLLDERIDIQAELYLALTIDRFGGRPMFLASRRGGMDIEAVAAEDPQAIVRESFSVAQGPSDEAIGRLIETFSCPPGAEKSGKKIIKALWEFFESADASLIEINPLVVTQQGRLLALDAKVTLDDSALFRHEALSALRDASQEEALELEATRIGISFVGLEGNIGCLVNGAGLAMATNDIIKLSGGNPANFLDVGGGANVEQVTKAFTIILADKKVKAILVNIFGGIMRCDWVAQGLLNATRKLSVKVPIVVRLQGTNVKEGRALLAQEAKGLNLISANELSEASDRIVELAKT